MMRTVPWGLCVIHSLMDDEDRALGSLCHSQVDG